MKNIQSEVTSLDEGLLTCMLLTQDGTLLLTGGGRRLSVRTWLNLTEIYKYKVRHTKVYHVVVTFNHLFSSELFQ